MWPYFQKKFEKKGFRLAERGELGWIYFFSKNKVTSMDDLRKQKLWTLGTTTSARASLDKLKLNGVPLGIAEVDAALTSGRINACFSSPLGAIALQWYSKLKYMSLDADGVRASARPCCSLDAVKKMSAEDQKIDRGDREAQPEEGARGDPQGQRGRAQDAVRKGITVVDPPKEMVDELTAIGATFRAS